MPKSQAINIIRHQRRVIHKLMRRPEELQRRVEKELGVRKEEGNGCPPRGDSGEIDQR
jgi:hypothetical protein